MIPGTVAGKRRKIMPDGLNTSIEPSRDTKVSPKLNNKLDICELSLSLINQAKRPSSMMEIYRNTSSSHRYYATEQNDHSSPITE